MYTASGHLDRSQSVRALMPMVRRQALALRVRLPESVALNDLVQAGMVGLLEAFDRFDAGQNASFETYASQRVRGAMIDSLRSSDWLPRSVRRDGRALTQAIKRLEHQLGRPPRGREIAREMGLSLDDYHSLLNDVNNGLILSYQEHDSEDEKRSVPAAGVETTDGNDNPFAALLASELRQHLIAAIDALPERERTLLGLYYQEELNLKEIGAVLGVSESRVSQLHSQAMARLRKALPAMD